MKILAIDPGPEKSAYLSLEDGRASLFDILDNKLILRNVIEDATEWVRYDHIVIEDIACYGMPVGRSTFQTCELIGVIDWLLMEVSQKLHRLTRPEVKLHLCGSVRAKDGNVRQALVDRFPKTGKNSRGELCSIGLKKTPGPLFGISTHVWSALAVAVTYFEKQKASKP